MHFCYGIKMQAIIFAAGRSRRLGALTDDKPKCVLPINNSSSVIDLSLANIAACGFKTVTIVTGHASSVLEEHLGNRFPQLSISYAYNHHYEEWNNIYTAYLVREFITDNCFIFNSDIVYDRRILASACESKLESFIVTDDHKPLVDEDMKVLVDTDGKILRINKNLDNSKCLGEYIGIMRLRDDSLKAFKKSLEYMIEAGDTDKYYEDALDRILADIKLGTVSTKAYSWTEIDTPEDYQRAKELECVKSISPTH